GTLKIGADADVTIIDPKTRWIVDPTRFKSKSVNTPFGGEELTGRAETVIVGGRIKYQLEGAGV
ncbi:MAG: dihydroorotase, partial [Planctomycetia bacterium]|nr:dihydroorotase [Planctomycetia bacterium]